jgi:bacterioferritin
VQVKLFPEWQKPVIFVPRRPRRVEAGVAPGLGRLVPREASEARPAPAFAIQNGRSIMHGDSQVVARLNEALKEELTAINQYFLHAEMSHNWGYRRLGAYIKKQAIDEMKHAEALIERILFLDSMPTMEPLPLTVGDNVRAQLERDLELEVKAVAMYNDAIRIAREAGDNSSRDLFERLLKDEEAHVDWLEAQLHMIKEIGYERYLSGQLEGEKD